MGHVCKQDRREAMFDARGIFLAYVCPRCRKEKMLRYRPEVFTDPDYWHDEPISEDHWGY